MTASTQRGRILAGVGYSADLGILLDSFETVRRRKGMINTTKQAPVIAGDQALTIAQTDAVKAYRDLSPYRIQLALEEDGWHIDYELKDQRLKGGGPHYIIDAASGAIVSKRYEQ
jgi:hypothetical protein